MVQIVNHLLVQETLVERRLLENLMHLYLHDFSEFARIDDHYREPDASGRFIHERLDSYWQEAGRMPLLFRFDGRIAGFALINQWLALDRELDHSIAEFFVLRKWRREGIGSVAFQQMLRKYPGRWEVPVAHYNRPALSFWRAAISQIMDKKVEEHIPRSPN